MSNREKVISDLETSKIILCNPNMINDSMLIKIGQAITNGIYLLKEQEPVIVRCKDCKYWHPLFKPDGYCDCDDMWRSLEGETTEVEYIRTNEDFYCGYAESRR